MERKEKKLPDKKIFIITPEELAKLGILDSLANAKSDPSTPTTTSKEQSKNILQKKPITGDNSLFKKPTEPKTSKETPPNKKTYQELTNDTELSSAILKLKESIRKKAALTKTQETASPSKKPLTTNRKRKNVIHDKDVPNKEKIEKFKKQISNKILSPKTSTAKKNSVSVLSNTVVNFSKEDLSNIVGQLVQPNFKNNRIIRPKPTLQSPSNDINLNVEHSSNTETSKTAPIYKKRNKYTPKINVNKIEKTACDKQEIIKEETFPEISSVSEVTEQTEYKKDTELPVLSTSASRLGHLPSKEESSGLNLELIKTESDDLKSQKSTVHILQSENTILLNELNVGPSGATFSNFSENLQNEKVDNYSHPLKNNNTQEENVTSSDKCTRFSSQGKYKNIIEGPNKTYSNVEIIDLKTESNIQSKATKREQEKKRNRPEKNKNASLNENIDNVSQPRNTKRKRKSLDYTLNEAYTIASEDFKSIHEKTTLNTTEICVTAPLNAKKYTFEVDNANTDIINTESRYQIPQNKESNKPKDNTQNPVKQEILTETDRSEPGQWYTPPYNIKEVVEKSPDAESSIAETEMNDKHNQGKETIPKKENVQMLTIQDLAEVDNNVEKEYVVNVPNELIHDASFDFKTIEDKISVHNTERDTLDHSVVQDETGLESTGFKMSEYDQYSRNINDNSQDKTTVGENMTLNIRHTEVIGSVKKKPQKSVLIEAEETLNEQATFPDVLEDNQNVIKTEGESVKELVGNKDGRKQNTTVSQKTKTDNSTINQSVIITKLLDPPNDNNFVGKQVNKYNLSSESVKRRYARQSNKSSQSDNTNIVTPEQRNTEQNLDFIKRSYLTKKVQNSAEEHCNNINLEELPVSNAGIDVKVTVKKEIDVIFGIESLSKTESNSLIGEQILESAETKSSPQVDSVINLQTTDSKIKKKEKCKLTTALKPVDDSSINKERGLINASPQSSYSEVTGNPCEDTTSTMKQLGETESEPLKKSLHIEINVSDTAVSKKRGRKSKNSQLVDNTDILRSSLLTIDFPVGKDDNIGTHSETTELESNVVDSTVSTLEQVGANLVNKTKRNAPKIGTQRRGRQPNVKSLKVVEHLGDASVNTSSIPVEPNELDATVEKEKRTKYKKSQLFDDSHVLESCNSTVEETQSVAINDQMSDVKQIMRTDSEDTKPVNEVTRKKRGRPPKSKNPPPEKPIEIEIPTEESRSGRKRAKINYLEIERSAEIPSKKKKISHPKEDVSVVPEDDSTSQNEEMKSDEIKVNTSGKKYRFTGETSKMISKMFSAASISSDSIIQSDESPKVRPSRKYGGKLAFVLRDEENRATCVYCQEKIEDENWNDHNRSEHYNLSWRDGETPLALDNYSVVREKLNPIFKRDKKLICFNCKKSCGKVKDFVVHKEECDGILIDGKVTCAVCNISVEGNQWLKHKSKHNNLAWRVGDHPLDLNNEALVLQVLNALYKAKKPLQCENCNAVKKSVIGFLSHRGQCGVTVEEAKIPCELCGKTCLPVSMPSHMKLCHSENSSRNTNTDKAGYFDVDINAPHGKRKAAAKALDKIDEFTKGENSEKLEYFKYYVKQLSFEEDKTFISYLNNELIETGLVKCKVKDCDYTIDETIQMLEHMRTCPLKSNDYYTCKKCFLILSSEAEVTQHLKLFHDLTVKVDVDYEQQIRHSDEEEQNELEVVDENSRKRKSALWTEPKKSSKAREKEDPKKAKPLFILRTSRVSKGNFRLFSHAFEYMFEFCEMNFTFNNILENLTCNKTIWNLMDEDSLNVYLPPVDTSCDVSKKTINGYEILYGSEHVFKQFEMFEVQQEEEYCTIFCGGPITSLAWLPTPYKSLYQPQLLAVAIGQDFNGNYNTDECYSERTLLQFWNFGILKNCKQIPVPNLEFCLAFDHGPIWHLEWCPSGCFNLKDSEEWARAGLLAVAGSTMHVHIFSIPLLKEDTTGLFYRAKPVLKLQLVKEETELKRKVFATIISWSKILGSTSIAVGYSDGNVAIFNLKNTSSLLCFKDQDSVDVLLPVKIIKAHSHFVTVLSWVPIDCDRWLLTASYDKLISVWDLYNEDKVLTKKSKILSDGGWLTNWLSFITTSEEATPSNGNILTNQVYHRHFLFESFNLSSSASTAILSTSDWLNGFLQADTTGEINAIFPHQLLYNPGILNKGIAYRLLMGYTALIDKTMTTKERVEVEKKKHDILKPIPRKTASSKISDLVQGKEFYDMYEPLEYQEAVHKYGVVFCDVETDKFHPLKASTKKSEFSKPHVYPLQEINKICFNPNRQASLYYATGYQIGFIRLTYIKYLENDPQIINSEQHNKKLS